MSPMTYATVVTTSTISAIRTAILLIRSVPTDGKRTTNPSGVTPPGGPIITNATIASATNNPSGNADNPCTIASGYIWLITNQSSSPVATLGLLPTTNAINSNA